MRKFIGFVAATAMALSSMAAQATNIDLTGTWEGSWAGYGITADFDMTILSQDSGGSFTGFIDWACTSGVVCSGIENIAGQFDGPDSDAFTFDTTSIVAGAINLGPSSYFGTVASDGLSLAFNTTDPLSAASADRVSGGSVPEPGPLALFGVGLLGLVLRQRRKA